MDMSDKKRHRKKRGSGSGSSGRLRIGDNWNAITIIALSQSNPLKAIAEFVENSIDAGARNITIMRGKEKGESFIRIVDDGEGIRKDENGLPDFKASELRDRIRKSEITIKITDRTARKELLVEPREFSGRLLHRLPAVSSENGEVYTELYLNESGAENIVGLYRSGTRVLNSITDLDMFRSEPWTSGWLQGIIDVPFRTSPRAQEAGSFMTIISLNLPQP